MSALLDVVLPVFVVIGAGYLVVWLGWFAQSGVEGLIRFTQNFAIPCLLFTAISQLDLGDNFNAPLLISFYTGALAVCPWHVWRAPDLWAQLGGSNRHRLLLPVLQLCPFGPADY